MSILDLESYMGAPPDGTSSNSAALQAALNTGASRLILKKASNGLQWQFPGTINIPSNIEIDLVSPDMKIACDGLERGWWMGPGTKRAHIKGAADVELYVTNTGGTGYSGEYSNAFAIGKYRHAAETDLIEDVSIDGDIRVTSTGPGNGNAVSAYGYIHGLRMRRIKMMDGKSNIAFIVHWAGDNADDSDEPTKIWCPTDILIEDCQAFNQGTNLNGLILSGTGIATVNDFYTDQVAEAVRFFGGDHGFKPGIVQNIPHHHIQLITLNRPRLNRVEKYGISVDEQCSKNGSDPWTTDGNQSLIYVNNPVITVADGATDCIPIAVSHAGAFRAKDVFIRDDNTGATKPPIQIFGAHDVELTGKIKSKNTVKIDSCANANVDMIHEGIEPGAVPGPCVVNAVSDRIENTQFRDDVTAGDTMVLLKSTGFVSGSAFYIEWGSQSVRGLVSTHNYDSPHPDYQWVQTEPMPTNVAKWTTATIRKVSHITGNI